MQRCLHGMRPETCAFCNRVAKEPARKPQPTTRPTLHGAEAIKRDELQGYVVVNTRGGKGSSSFQAINETTTVHISSFPYLWAFEDILAKAPRLQTIRVLPTLRSKLSSKHESLCQARGVTIVTGLHNPQMAWKKGENRSPHYERQRAFLLELTGEQRLLFDELLALGNVAAQMTERYFCLSGEDYKSQTELAEEWGYTARSANAFSWRINAVLRYLDPTFQVGRDAVRVAEVIRRNVAKLRPLVQGDVLRRRFRDKYGFSLAQNFPPLRLDAFEEILAARDDGRLGALKAKSPDEWLTIILRFGLDRNGAVYRTINEITEMSPNVGRGGVWFREIRAFEFLKIHRVAYVQPTKLLNLEEE